MGQNVDLSNNQGSGDTTPTDPIEEFWKDPCGDTLLRVGRMRQTPEMVQAVIDNGANPPFLGCVAEDLRTYDICYAACAACGLNLSGVPSRILNSKICRAAIESTPTALGSVPHKFLSIKLCVCAVSNDPTGQALKSVPDRILEGKQGRNICELAVERSPRALRHVPEQYLTEEMILGAISRDASAIAGLPEKVLTKEMVSIAVEGTTATCQPIIYVPKALLTRELIGRSKELCPWSTRALHVTEEAHSSVSDGQGTEMAISEKDSFGAAYELAIPGEPGIENVFYISDIHLCHQVEIRGKDPDEVREKVDFKVRELVSTLHGGGGTVIVAGDVADSIEVAKVFWKSLCRAMANRGCYPGMDLRTGRRWTIIALAGNHELWDYGLAGEATDNDVDTIIKTYRGMFSGEGFRFLQNDLLVNYRNQTIKTLDEETILGTSDDELRKLFDSATLIVLGGIGFAGLNPRFNVDMDMYGMRVLPDGTAFPRMTRDEEIRQSARFEKLYEKVLQCASDKQVIVATHTPMEDWSGRRYNPNWVYISGHTHQNRLVRDADGTTILSDNQVGYIPSRWHFNSFTRRGLYDPFAFWDDGIYDISKEQYTVFNQGRGILVKSLKWPGQVRMVKRAGSYMFFIHGTNLNVLSGGQRKKAEHSIEYYYKNLPLYRRLVQDAFEPYHRALEMLSGEIKAFGGAGIIHGCIVDIDWWKHLYLNPFDGKITPYFALSAMSRWEFEDIPALLAAAPNPFLPEGSLPTLERYEAARREGRLPLLSACGNDSDKALATIPEFVLDRGMYSPSRIMRSIQYIFDQGVVRVWNDAVFADSPPKDKCLAAKEGPLRAKKRIQDKVTKPKRLTEKEMRAKRAEAYAEKVALRSDGKIEVK